MAKPTSKFVCQQCNAEYPKWQGQCGQCGQWNTLVETIISSIDQRSKRIDQRGEAVKTIKLSEIKGKVFKRIPSGMKELDRVLGGGIVSGSVVLVAGQPGIGKSTLLTQLAMNLSEVEKSRKGSTCLYVCGEESPAQIKLRIQRITDKNLSQYNLEFLPETNMENILASIYNLSPNNLSPLNLIIIDSIQTIWTSRLTGTAGSIGQVRECSNILLTLAKKTNIPIFLIGHITKEGSIAGPKVLEHLVDTVLYLEGEKDHDFRILRTSKNRFGPTDEVGVFRMQDSGMKEVSNPGEIFVEQNSNSEEQRVGSVITMTMQGIRPLLVEIQALVIPSNLSMPRRVASGISGQRLQVLCAVIQKKLGIPLYQSDVFVNVAGGLKIFEPAADLAICLAIISSFKNKPIPHNSLSVGEVGLLGEIRRVSFMDKRVKEAKKLGYKYVIGETERDLREINKIFR